MADGKRSEPQSDASRSPELSRREFSVASLAGGLSMAAGQVSATAQPLVETDVDIKTPDGVSNAAFIRPDAGAHPGVLIWTDAFGLRPTFREMGRRLAREGYAVLIPNPYYRIGMTPGGLLGLNFQNPDERAKLMSFMGTVNAPGAAERDAVAYVDFLDAQPSVRKASRIGVNGYCMGGALTMRTAAIRPDRVGAGGSFHGGGLVTDKPDSPHLLVPKMKARFYFGIADNDDKNQPDAKDKLKAAFAGAKLPADIEVYAGCLHGWCVSDMPERDGVSVYNQAMADRAWGHLLDLYKTTLA